MISFDLGIIAYTERYLLGRSVSRDYATTLRQRIESFCEWAGADIPIHALTCDIANEWLAALADDGVSAWSLSGYRGALLAVWNAAYQAGDCREPPLRVRRVTRPRLIVEAYTHGEIKALLKVAAGLPRLHKDGNRAADFWLAAVNVAYCCGPRRGDLLAVDWKQVSRDRVLSFVQHKTGFPNRAVLTKQAVELCRQLKGNGRLLPYPYHEDWFSRSFKRLRTAAGIERGTFKWIRRSAGSYAERERKGAGAQLLGHRDATVFRRFYEDQTISEHAPPQPPPL